MSQNSIRPALNVGLAYIVGLMIILSGIMISMKTSDWTWFSRSGAALVIIGIIFSSSQIIENGRRLRIKKHHPSHTHDWAPDEKMQTINMNRGHEHDTWIHGRCGFNMLILGTSIWGFGDLIGLLF